VQALGTVPIRIFHKGNRSAVVIERFSDGRIPIRLDTRLLRNVEALKTVTRHEVAEIDAILSFESEYYPAAALQRLLRTADDAGYRSERLGHE
jgi:hypothetical protein